MMSLPKSVSGLVVSDLHINHPKLSPARMVNSLIKGITTNFKTKVMEYLIITGDVFDRPTQTDTVAGKESTRFISFCLDYAVKHNLILIVLRGTGSHDGTQTEQFVSMNEGRLVKAELIYIDKISILTDRNSITWLGVPDESCPSAAQTQAEIESLMKSKGISSTQLAVTHGLYNTHNLNGIVDTHAHDTQWYCSVVDYCIFNGHIHHPSTHDKLTTIGSFDRNRHGEEEPKGGWTFKLDLVNKVFERSFFENTEAELFITYKIKGNTIKEALKEINNFLLTHPLNGGGYLRIAYPEGLNINDLVRLLQDKYSPTIEFSTLKVGDSKKEEDINNRVVEFSKIDTTPITPDTINDVLLDKLERNGIENIDECMNLFNKVYRENIK